MPQMLHSATNVTQCHKCHTVPQMSHNSTNVTESHRVTIITYPKVFRGRRRAWRRRSSGLQRTDRGMRRCTRTQTSRTDPNQGPELFWKMMIMITRLLDNHGLTQWTALVKLWLYGVNLLKNFSTYLNPSSNQVNGAWCPNKRLYGRIPELKKIVGANKARWLL